MPDLLVYGTWTGSPMGPPLIHVSNFQHIRPTLEQLYQLKNQTPFLIVFKREGNQEAMFRKTVTGKMLKLPPRHQTVTRIEDLQEVSIGQMLAIIQP